MHQGRFLALAETEKEDMVWKYYMFDLKQGTLKFLLNACIDTLPTAANLHKCITVKKPGIEIQDKKNKFIHLFELSVHIKTNGNIDKRHKWKSDRYAHFVTDMPGYNCSVTAFEIGNKEPLSFIHTA